ncbi:molybdate ABC transporter substrate-binding protein [Geobacter sp. DSM 9736]|uniref:molybdate ABC transporter substrate-binding protein n=1 Tax=Geobacter sp. DSM 9736 TaxID=1277350 RepID=UPI000B50BB7F|nr:molybdate ABC transporter substrate-binding protein [Geobacter sp. DSM 9736]SNB45189.1 molybdate transport system substrate-binding protein [Geobacter sp. DSM 9736]
MKLIKLLVVACTLLTTAAAHAEQVTIAAAADLKFAMDEIVASFRKMHPGDKIQVTYGSSGKFHTQIQQGAPFDLFFSADITFPQELVRLGLAASEAAPYALGRIVLWSNTLDASRMTLVSLADPRITRIALANPKHAPYGKRAEEALRASGLWDKLQPKLVFGENIAQTAQFVQSGNAQIGIIALSLALNLELAKNGGYYLIPGNLHNPLEQGFIVTRKGAGKASVGRFAEFMGTKSARDVLKRYGFIPLGEKTGK